MNGLPYYKAYPRDFIDGTAGMRLELKGAYRVVLDLIYMHGGRLPDDARYIAGHLGCSVRMWNSLRAELVALAKIVSRDSALFNFRADKELESLRKFSANQAEKASRARKINTLQQPRLSHTDTDTDKKEDTPPAPRKRVVGVEPPGFSEFWEVYPRKVAKGAARKAWVTASRTTDPPTIIAAAMRLEDRGQYTPHAATWLNAERWTDQEQSHGQRGQNRTGSPLFDAAMRVAERERASFGTGDGGTEDDPGNPRMAWGAGGGVVVPLLATGRAASYG